jgi:hypothetical protein
MLPMYCISAGYAQRTTTFGKRFLYVCAALLCLALAYHLGARNATAQARANPIVGVAAASPADVWVVLADGSVYWTGDGAASWSPRSNVFGAPIAQSTYGSAGARHR